MNANKAADTILSWYTDDELSDEEEFFFLVLLETKKYHLQTSTVIQIPVMVKEMMIQTPSLNLLYRQHLSACWAETALFGNAPIQ